ncbi:MAG: 30S ribosomal protein S6e [Candidatus Jordarchaeum sp.]|uniref:30S ribosomal protein S6e n=1 Tax=Candidatus Jordarchaeum sp. TaxID=2823881 RepID=UPI00404B0626
MPGIKLVISDPEKGRSIQIEVDETKARALFDARLGQKVDGGSLGFGGYEFLITGGSDRDGFPMRKGIHGPVRKRVFIGSGPGFHPPYRGQRKRKMVRGDTVSEDIAQLNLKILKKGAKDIFE